MPNDLLVTTTDILGIEVAKDYSGASGIYVDNVNNIISITGDVGKEYSGVQPIVVNNEENLISANSAPIGVQEPLYFVQDDDEAVVIGLSGEYVTPSDIAGKLDTSSFESWQQGQYTNDLTAINEKINEVSSNIPSLEGYATEQWVEDKGYLTAVNVPESANWEDTSNVVKSNSGTWNTVTDKLDVTAQVISSCETSSVDGNTLVTKLNGNEIAVEYAGSARIANIALKDYQGNSFVPFYAKTSALEEKLNTSTFAEASGNFQPRGDYVERDFVLSSIEYATSGKLDVSSFASVSSDFLTTSFGISESAHWEEATNAYEQNSATYLTAHQSLDGYATETFVEETSGAITSLIPTDYYPDTNPSGFISGVDLSPYQTIEGMTAYQPVGDYATTAEVDTLSSMLSAAIDYVSANAGDEFPVSADEAVQYVQTNSAGIDGAVNSVRTNSGAWGGEALPISSRDGLDLEVDNGTLYIGASALTGTIHAYKQNSASYLVENNFEYDGNELITAYNGSAFAGQGGGGGGGDVPTGTMNVTGLEYNAVNEISGYNGSAIAQYGAAKQWLVHDDTLVHASNSAQYALGVNLPNISADLARLMGVDETVLFEAATPTAVANLSETWKNFDRLRICVQNVSNDNGWTYVEVRPLVRDGYTPYYNIVAGFSYGLGTNGMIWQNIIGSATDTELTNCSSFGFQNSWTASEVTIRKNNLNDLNCIRKVIGIGRLN